MTMKKLATAVVVASSICFFNMASAQIPVVGGWVDLKQTVRSVTQQKQIQQQAEKAQQAASTTPKEK
jgi:Skp family chaperone for outer membrane proteins